MNTKLSAPKSLLFLPVFPQEGAPPTYAMIAMRDLWFFNDLREHRELARLMATTGAREPQQNPDGKWEARTKYTTLTAGADYVYWLHSSSECNVIDKRMKGVEDLEALLALTATSVLKNDIDCATMLDVTDGDAEPVIINFHEWYENVRSNGWFQGTIEEFFDTLVSCECSTGDTNVRVELPWMLNVDRIGPQPTYKNFDDHIHLTFSTMTGSEMMETENISIEAFLRTYEDVVRTTL